MLSDEGEPLGVLSEEDVRHGSGGEQSVRRSENPLVPLIEEADDEVEQRL